MTHPNTAARTIGGYISRAKQRGVTMVEALLGLTAIAIVTAAGIVAFQTVQVRTEARSISNALLPFLVDMAEYLESYHDPEIFGSESILASTLTGSAGATSATLSGTGGVTAIKSSALPNVSADTCSDSTVTSPTAATCAAAGGIFTPANTVSPLHVRIANLPSIQFRDGPDTDATAEWSIPLNQNTDAEIRWVIEPASNAALGGTNLSSCVFTANRDKPDTTVAAQLFFKEKNICDEVAKAQGRFDHVQAAQCHDEDSSTNWHEGKTNTEVASDEYEAALFICFNDMR